MQYDYLIKGILVGPQKTGKSSMMSTFCMDTFSQEYASTIGVEFAAKVIEVNQKNVKAQIWDTAGDQKFKSITNSYYKGSGFAIFVFDISSMQSFEETKQLILEAFYQNKVSDGCTALLVGAKCDLADERQVSYEDAQQIGEAIGGYMEASSKTRHNLDETFTLALSNKMKCDNNQVEGFNTLIKKAIELEKFASLKKQGLKKYDEYKEKVSQQQKKVQQLKLEDQLSQINIEKNKKQQCAAPGDPSPSPNASISEPSNKLTKTQQSQPFIVKCILVGPENTGKSSLMYQYTEKAFTSSYLTTIGVDFKIKLLTRSDKTPLKLQIWDTAGQKRFQSISVSYYKSCQIIFYVFSVTDKQSFSLCKNFVKTVRTQIEIENAIQILVGNKTDLERAVVAQEAMQYAAQENLDYVEVSSTNFEQVDNLFTRALEAYCAKTKKQ